MYGVNRENLIKTCFFCSNPIEEKKSLEHIIADGLLGKLGLKEKTIEGQGKFQYSRIKVPAHSTCNTTFGSRYENEIQTLLDNPDDLYRVLIQEENLVSQTYQPSNDPISLITTWLSKVYYGLFYNDFLKLDHQLLIFSFSW